MPIITCRSFLSIYLLFPTLILALWPAPKYFHNGSDVLWVPSELTFTYRTSGDGLGHYWNSLQQILGYTNLNGGQPEDVAFAEELLAAAVTRAEERLTHAIVPRKFHRRKIPFEPSLDAPKTHLKSITFNKVARLSDDRSEEIKSTEGYILKLHKDGTVVVDVIGWQGGLHALETFTQLFYRHSQDPNAVYTHLAPFQIIDEPAFPHRGINLDIARNSISPIDIMKQIAAMSACKLNRLHLHASDAQSWPLEIPSYPELAQEGAYDELQIWSVGDLERVQRFGMFHGIEVYLEIDLPGHSTAVGGAFPAHLTAQNMQPWDRWALEPPSGQMRLNSSATMAFVKDILNDLAARVSLYSSLFHIGGDELNKLAYELDPTVRSSDPAVLKPLLQAFVGNASQTTISHGLTPIVWEEMVLDWNLDLTTHTIVQSWRDPTSLAKIVAKGHRAIFGSSTHWYLDCGHGCFLDPNKTNPDTPIKSPYNDWCSPYKSWRQVYSYDPMRDIPKKHHHLVMGGEVSLWGELTDSVTVDGMLWPRAAAAAEVMWSGSGQEVNEGATRRLAELRERLVASGISAGMVQMEWCSRNEGCCML